MGLREERAITKDGSSETCAENEGEQHELGILLLKLGHALQSDSPANAVLTADTALTAIAVIRRWLDLPTIVAAFDDTRREQLEEWEDELSADVAHFRALCEAVHDELHMSLRNRNRDRGDLNQQS